MSEQPIEPVELAPLLSSHHVPGFSEAQQWLLVARLWGGDWPYLAEVMHSTPDTLRRQFGGMVDVIVKPFGLPRGTSLLPRTGSTSTSTATGSACPTPKCGSKTGSSPSDKYGGGEKEKAARLLKRK